MEERRSNGRLSEASKPGEKKTSKHEPGIQHDGGFFSRFNRNQFRFSIWFFLGALVLVLLANSFLSAPAAKTVEFSTFKKLIESGKITTVQIGPDTYIGTTKPSPTTDQGGGAQSSGLPAPFNFKIPGISARSPDLEHYRTVAVDDPSFIPLLDAHHVNYYAIPSRMNPALGFLLNWIVPFGLLFLVWRFVFKKMNNAGPDVLSFSKNKAQVVAEGETGIRFSDVAGCDEAKSELEEVVDFLKRPEKYAAIGGKIPKGVLLVGVPGTGKTLLAKAVAGEAGVPFFRMSGADFVEMFVGVGAARVRDLFRQAREKAPCIIFIDELDAIGKRRQNGFMNNDEREQTLNQLLVELDGFDSRTGVIILGATNRPEILDPALLRAGRFDRRVAVEKPNLDGREAILRIHTRGLQMNDHVDLRKIARATPGMSGADLANLANEAALLAVREGRERVTPADFEEAVEKVIAGLKKKKRLLDPQERNRVAVHESGHALVAHLTAGADPVEKISIIPRSIGALGFTMQLPQEERYLMTERELLGQVDVLLGGRASELLLTGEISTGAADDLTRATDIVHRMITEFGMSGKFPNVCLPTGRSNNPIHPDNGSLFREYSETTQQYVDEETARIIAERFETVKSILQANRSVLRKIAERLLEVEVMGADEFQSLVSKSDPAKAPVASTV